MENINGIAQIAEKVLMCISLSIFFQLAIEAFLSTQVKTVPKKFKAIRKAPVAVRR